MPTRRKTPAAGEPRRAASAQDTAAVPTAQSIARRAYELFVERGGVHGRDWTTGCRRNASCSLRRARRRRRRTQARTSRWRIALTADLYCACRRHLVEPRQARIEKPGVSGRGPDDVGARSPGRCTVAREIGVRSLATEPRRRFLPGFLRSLEEISCVAPFGCCIPSLLSSHAVTFAHTLREPRSDASSHQTYLHIVAPKLMRKRKKIGQGTRNVQAIE